MEIQKFVTDARQQVSDWVTQSKKANEKLYAVLAKALELLKEIEKDPTQREALFNLAKKENLEVDRKTPNANLVVRIIFAKAENQVDSYKASTYGTAIRIALSESVAPADFPQWLRDNGGIEKLRRQNPRNGGGDQGGGNDGSGWKKLNSKLDDLMKDGHTATLNHCVRGKPEGTVLLPICRVTKEGRILVYAFVADDDIDDHLAAMLAERANRNLRLFPQPKDKSFDEAADDNVETLVKEAEAA